MPRFWSTIIFSLALIAGCDSGPRFKSTDITGADYGKTLELTDHTGRARHLEDFRGKAVVLFFGFTHCPDVCPLTADHLNQALAALGPARRSVRVLAVSVDPLGDTRTAIASFLRAHALLPEFRYLTGTPEALRAVWAAYGVGTKPRGGGGRDHTLYTLLLDRAGRGRVIYDANAKPTDISHDLRLLLGRG